MRDIPSNRRLTMTYFVEIQRISESGRALKPVQVFGTDTSAEAINLAINELAAALPETYPLNVNVLDERKQLILSYTSSSPQISYKNKSKLLISDPRHAQHCMLLIGQW